MKVYVANVWTDDFIYVTKAEYAEDVGAAITRMVDPAFIGETLEEAKEFAANNKGYAGDWPCWH